jgi:mycoredoxin
MRYTTAMSSGIKFYGATWCADCKRAQQFLDSNNVPYTYINIDSTPEAAAIVADINHGQKSIPTIVFEDGSILVEPSNRELAEHINKG